jgi:uncharacterized protein
MSIDWMHFTPWSAAAGGLVLGVATALLVLLNGRVFGISGILGGLVRPVMGDAGWRIALLVGLVLSPTVWRLFGEPATLRIEAGWPVLVVAGLLVGWGTRYGSGCTSGHGVCGLSRLSPRSLVATLSFMAAGIVTVYVVRHLLA